MTEFHYPYDLLDFNYLIVSFQKETFEEENTNKNVDENDCNIFGAQKHFDRLIVMDDNSGVADK